MSIHIKTQVGVPSVAELVLPGGDPGSGSASWGDDTVFDPGADIGIRAGSGVATSPDRLFTGPVAGHHLRGGADGRALLTVECRGPAPVVPALSAHSAPALKATWGSDILHFQVGARVGDPAGLNGRVRLPGTAAATVGGTIELVGLGRRFGGPVGILSVTHELGADGWVTEVGFGAASVTTAPVAVPAPAAAPLALPATVAIQDQNGNTVTLDAQGIRLDTPGDLVLSAGGAIRLGATGAVAITTQSDATLRALNLHADAAIHLTLKGGAEAELSASGVTTVKGALVMIN